MLGEREDLDADGQAEGLGALQEVRVLGAEGVEGGGDVRQGAGEGAEGELVGDGAVGGGLGGLGGVGGEEGLNAGEIQVGQLSGYGQ